MCSGSSKVRANRGNGDWSCSGLRRMDCNLGSAKSVDFVRVSDMQRIKHGRRKVLVIRNSNPSSDIAELQASSEGSPLLVIIYLYFTDDDYQKELEHIEQVFNPLVENCNKYGRATRIGTNHGSLSDRIMSYYGDSPRGMVESAFEFARICRKLDYHNFVFSMKASKPIIMVQAYRLLVAEMYVQGWDYPLHLEADGRMKSAIGIGTLLQDGLGDTIRVSLTEPPEEEIDPCRRLANLGMKASDLQQGVAPFEEKHRHYFDFQPRTGQSAVQRTHYSFHRLRMKKSANQN